jgi:hypothetical protein
MPRTTQHHTTYASHTTCGTHCATNQCTVRHTPVGATCERLAPADVICAKLRFHAYNATCNAHASYGVQYAAHACRASTATATADPRAGTARNGPPLTTSGRRKSRTVRRPFAALHIGRRIAVAVGVGGAGLQLAMEAESAEDPKSWGAMLDGAGYPVRCTAVRCSAAVRRTAVRCRPSSRRSSAASCRSPN